MVMYFFNKTFSCWYLLLFMVVFEKITTWLINRSIYSIDSFRKEMCQLKKQKNNTHTYIYIYIYIYRVLAWNSKLAQSDRSNSIWPNDIIIIWLSWLVFSCISSQWAHCSIFKHLAFICCSSLAAHLRNPPPSPAPPVEICYEVNHVCYMGLFICVICAAAAFPTCSQQHVVDVLAVASLGICSDAAAAAA